MQGAGGLRRQACPGYVLVTPCSLTESWGCGLRVEPFHQPPAWDPQRSNSNCKVRSSFCKRQVNFDKFLRTLKQDGAEEAGDSHPLGKPKPGAILQSRCPRCGVGSA